jgi:hypothetical protein
MPRTLWPPSQRPFMPRGPQDSQQGAQLAGRLVVAGSALLGVPQRAQLLQLGGQLAHGLEALGEQGLSILVQSNIQSVQLTKVVPN